MASVWNTSSWHWEEKDYTSWSQDRLKELLSGVLYETETAKIESTSVNVNGDAHVNVRKNKAIVGYELDITLHFKGELRDGERKSSINGKYKLPYVCEDVDEKAFEITLSITGKGTGNHPKDDEEEKKKHEERIILLDEMAREQIPRVMELVLKYVEELESKVKA